jgi:cytochrome b6-f complex iron-sulfur subunit
MNRRAFLSGALGMCGCATAAWPGWISLRYLAAPAPSAALPVDVASREEVESRGHLVVPFRGSGAILIAEGGAIRALSLRCTHAGCLVNWNPKERRFLCPCHGGVFDERGERVSGPPPAPLAVLKPVVRGRRIFLSD